MLDIESRVSGSIEVFYGVRGKSNSDIPIPEAARRIAEAGFGVEILIADSWEQYKTLASEETIQQLAEVCRTASFVTTHACVAEWAPDAFKTEVLTAARIGIPLMVIHPYVLGLDLPDSPSRDAEARDLCKFALDHGVMLALENLGKTAIAATRRGLDKIGTDPESTGLGVCVDIGHANRSCTDDGIRPEAFLREFRDMIMELHIDDNFGVEDLHLPPGEGSIDWRPVLDEIQTLRDDTVLCLEITSQGDPIETLRASRDFLAIPIEH